MDNAIYTIGHSQHNPEEFICMLKSYNINYVLDVRSTPYSQFAVEYNREIIEKRLLRENVRYAFMGKFFGARPKDKDLYSQEGYLDFDRTRKSEKFQRGVYNVLKGIEEGNRIVLMCTEKDPIECHRAIMVARSFYEQGVNVQHILADGSLQSHDTLNQRLMDLYFPDRYQYNLFGEIKSDDEYLEEAYRYQNEKIGYHIEDKPLLVTE